MLNYAYELHSLNCSSYCLNSNWIWKANGPSVGDGFGSRPGQLWICFHSTEHSFIYLINLKKIKKNINLPIHWFPSDHCQTTVVTTVGGAWNVIIDTIGFTDQQTTSLQRHWDEKMMCFVFKMFENLFTFIDLYNYEFFWPNKLFHHKDRQLMIIWCHLRAKMKWSTIVMAAVSDGSISFLFFLGFKIKF